MKALVSYRIQAENMRRAGKTYNEILEVLPVAKSSLSAWLSKLPLSEKEKQFVRRHVKHKISRGRVAAALANHTKRLVRDEVLRVKAFAEYDRYIGDPFFETGLALYWAEGAKKNSTFQFVNSDVQVIRTMVNWISKYLDIPKNALGFRLYIHKPYAHENCEQWWLKELGISASQLKKTVYKPTHRLIKKNINYKGCMRIEVGPVTAFRTTLFWLSRFKKHYISK